MSGETSHREVLSALGHELRRPLTVIRGAANLLLQSRDEMPAAARDDMLGLIERGVESMTDLIEDVLCAVHLEAGDLHLEEGPVEVAGIVEEALEAARRTDASRQLIVLGSQPGLTAEADRTQAVRALRALLVNAVRFSPPGAPVEVLVSCAGSSIRLEVRDRGPGLPAAQVEGAFERFAKLEHGAAGAGLGLYLARGLARKMGGDVGHQPRQGGGSTFWFTLKRHA